MRKQAIRYGAAGVVGVILAVLLVVMVNWIGAHRYARWDWTSTKLYSLSQKTEAILGELTDEVQVVVFMVPGSPLYDQASELLSRYSAASDKIKVEYIDPDREPLRTQQLAESFGISVADTVVFAAGERTKYVTSDQMAEYDYAGMQYGQQPNLRAFKGEEQFTAAILSLVASDVPKVYFVGGHGEASLSAGAMGERGLAVLAEALKRENMETEEAVLLSGTIPEDADVLAIVGPTQPYTEVEIAVLGEYLDGGGRLLVCLDPLIDSDGTMRGTRLEAFLAERGVEVRDDLVVDPSRKLPFYDLSAVYLTDFRSHAITKGLDGVAVLFLVTRSIGPVDEGDASVTTLVETTVEGWGETDLASLLLGDPVDVNDSDTEGPVGVGVAVELAAADETDSDAGESAGARLVVFGDSDFLGDSEIANAGNLTLALNTFGWLVHREHTAGIPPRQVEQLSLYLTAQQLSTILLVTMVLMPGAAIVAGIVVWRRRKH